VRRVCRRRLEASRPAVLAVAVPKARSPTGRIREAQQSVCNTYCVSPLSKPRGSYSEIIVVIAIPTEVVIVADHFIPHIQHHW
jgi:hypothetical protein